MKSSVQLNFGAPSIIDIALEAFAYMGGNELGAVSFYSWSILDKLISRL